MHDPHDRTRPLRVGSLFSGYGGLDLAVEHALDAETIWFSENNEHVARIFAHHWPNSPNLGDITTIDWRDVPPDRRALRRIPLPGRIDRGQARRPRARHPLGPVVAHGRSDRRTATPARRHRERARPAVLTRRPRTAGRKRRCTTQTRPCNPR